LATSASNALVSVVLPVERPPATRMLRRSWTASQGSATRGRHHPGCGIVVESEHRNGGFADGEARRGDNGRQQTFEAPAGLGQFGRDARRPGMHFGTDVMRD